MNYYDLLFKESEEEKLIRQRIEAERKHFEATQVYQDYKAVTDSLYDELFEAGNRRRKEAEKYKSKRIRVKHLSENEMEEFRRKNHELREKKIEALPNELKILIRSFETLDDSAKRLFEQYTLIHRRDYKEYENPITTKKDLKELLEILVQTTIDFINERGLTDIDGIGFSTDGLQDSARWGEWAPSTDASISATGIGKEKGRNGEEYSVVQTIGNYM